MGAKYVWIVLPGGYLLIQAFSAAQFATSQGHTSVSLYCYMVGTLAHFCCIQLFVNGLDWGFTGVCIATSIGYAVRFLVVYILVEFSPGLKNIYGVRFFSHETIQQVQY